MTSNSVTNGERQYKIEIILVSDGNTKKLIVVQVGAIIGGYYFYIVAQVITESSINKLAQWKPLKKFITKTARFRHDSLTLKSIS